MSSHVQRVRGSKMDWPGWFARIAGDHPRCPEHLGLTAAEVSKQDGVVTSGGEVLTPMWSSPPPIR